jgi:hypothetical protein
LSPPAPVGNPAAPVVGDVGVNPAAVRVPAAAVERDDIGARPGVGSLSSAGVFGMAISMKSARMETIKACVRSKIPASRMIWGLARAFPEKSSLAATDRASFSNAMTLLNFSNCMAATNTCWHV